MKNDFFIKKIENIQTELFSVKNTISDLVSFLGGTSGISLFLFYASQFNNSEKDYNRAFSILEETVALYSQTAVAPPSLAKMGWMLNHLD